jgi:hypothetical protein
MDHLCTAVLGLRPLTTLVYSYFYACWDFFFKKRRSTHFDILLHSQCPKDLFSVLGSLEENHICDEGVYSLAEGLKRNSTLKFLK